MRETIPTALREAVLKRDGCKCQYCGRYAQTIHLEHIIPVSRGGGNYLHNLVVACAPCNAKKAARIPRDETEMPALKVPCDDCGIFLSVWDMDRWTLEYDGLHGRCPTCEAIAVEVDSWDSLMIAVDMGVEAIAE